VTLAVRAETLTELTSRVEVTPAVVVDPDVDVDVGVGEPEPAAGTLTDGAGAARSGSIPLPAAGAATAAVLAFGVTAASADTTVIGSTGQSNTQAANSTQSGENGSGGGGTYILIYAPDGRCLTAPALAGSTAATLARCNLSSSQRWRHQYLGKDPAGRDSWRLRNAADGRCLTAAQAPLGGQPGESGVGLSACKSSAVAWRQIVSFQTAY